MKLYYSTGACSLSDHIVLEWTGAPYEAVRVSREQRQTPEFHELNPAGAVPVFEQDGWVLTQNAAILNYLADRFPDAKLGGDGTPEGRAEQRLERRVHVGVDEGEPAVDLGATAYLDDPAVIEKTKENAKTSLRGLFERTNTQLAGREWIAGGRSVADPYLYVVLRWAKAQGVDLAGLDNLAAFVARMEADPAVIKVLRDEGLG